MDKNKSLKIVLTTDEKYIRYVAVTIVSICVNTQSSCFFYIISDNVSQKSKKKIEKLCKEFTNLTIEWINLSKGDKKRIQNLFLQHNKNNLYTKNLANYSRFMIPELLNCSDKVLYLDTDILVQGDLQPLFDTDLENNIIAAVPSTTVPFNEYAYCKARKYISDKHVYFNAGVLLIDCDKWRKNNITYTLSEIDKKICNYKLFNTQDPLNVCFDNNYKILNHKYNFTAEVDTLTNIDISKYLLSFWEPSTIYDCIIRHYTDKKPDLKNIQSDTLTYDKEMFYKYAIKTDFYTKIFKLPQWLGQFICCFILKQEHRYNFCQRYITTNPKTKIFYKERCANGRRYIYFCGIKIFSYKKANKTIKESIDTDKVIIKYISSDRLDVFLKEKFYKITGKLPSEHLSTLNDKLLYLAMFERNEKKKQCADKIAVREYVKEAIGETYLPELYDVLENGEAFSPYRYPDRFVLSYNAGSGENIIVTKKENLDINKIKKRLNDWLVYANHAYSHYEMQYYHIIPRVIVREYLDMKTDIEYKCFCFHGVVEFIQCISYKHGHSNIECCHYNKKWERLPFYRVDSGCTELKEDIPQPDNLNLLIELSEKLAKIFKFARIDFYETFSGNLKFGEITFTPTAAKIIFGPDNDYWQKYYGDKLII